MRGVSGDEWGLDDRECDGNRGRGGGAEGGGSRAGSCII